MSASVDLTAVPTPRQSTAVLVRAINQRDLDAAARCFAKDACLLTPDSTAIRGRDEIRPILAQMIARSPQIEVQASSVLVAGDVALAKERWVTRSAGAQDAVFVQESTATLVLRQLEGVWKLGIAALWGSPT
ncbi:MAG TPA: nuclear transport factor 2 family protein [Solirubrobacterales bacterium]|nr:nuclear transport factor 2 family protein [Solirubrobacterales bacterium]